MRLVHFNADRGISPRRAKGAAVHLAAMRAAFTELGVEVLSLDEPDPELGARRLEELHAAGGVDVLYERLALDAPAGAAFARRHGIPHVLEVNAPLDEEEQRYRAQAGRDTAPDTLREALVGASEVLCVSRACAAWAEERGAAPERVLVAGNGVDARLFHPGRRAEGHALHALDDEAFVIGFHGRLRPWHGFERVVAATASLRARGVPAHLLIVGRGEFAPHLEGHLEPTAWTHIEWVNHEEVGSLIARFDTLPLAYDPDQPCYFSPLKLLEGMAAGAVAVVPDLGDLAAEVRHGAAGVVYDPRDQGALARELAALHDAPGTRATLATAARAVAEKRSWLGIAEGVLSRLEVSA